MHKTLSNFRDVLRKIPLGLVIVVLCTSQLIAQERNVTGKVSSADDGSGLPGVNIIIKGTTTGTVTDTDGNFTLGVQATDAVLVFSAIGYATQEVTVGSQSNINVTLEVDITSLSEVIVVGYGTQDKRDVTASIGSISSDAITKIANTNTLESMKGQIAGVDVQQVNGRPGSTPSVLIRGRRSINASNDPLFVIDGIPMSSGTSMAPDGVTTTSGSNPLNDFNPSDIASIEVLKDAAATAIYGSRGANGVVLITTKRGKSGKTSVSYNGYYGITQVFNKFPMMTGPEFADLKREASRRSPLNVTGRTAWEGTLPADNIVFPDPIELYSVNNGLSTDWQDLVFKDGSQADHQISVSGGNDKSQYNMSLGYFQQDGTIPGMDFNKITARINFDHQLSKRIKVGMSNQLARTIQNNGSGSVMQEMVNQTPLGLWYEYVDATGLSFPDPGAGRTGPTIKFLPISDGIRSNPLSELVPGKRIDEEKITRVFSSAYLEAEIFKGLKYKALFGADMRYSTRGIFEGRFTNTRKNGDPSAQYNSQSNEGFTLENLLTYNKSFGDHTLGLTFLQSIQENKYETEQIFVTGLPYETQKWFNVATASTISAIRSRYTRWGLVSFMGRLNYSFKGKYLLQASLRSDGSSRLAPGAKYTNFPGVSVGWRIKDEGFMSSINVISDLKFRASYGSVGNTSFEPYATQGVLGRSVYSWDEANAAGFALGAIPNAELGWEKSSTTDIGLDFGVFNGRLSGTVDYYITNTTDLLLRRNLPPSSGYDFAFANIGATRQAGFEVTLNANVLTLANGLKWDIDFNVARYKEEIVDLAQRDANGNKTDDPGNSWFIGQPLRVFYDYQKIGLWQSNELTQAQAMMGGYPGEIKLQDTDGSGTIAPADRVILGNDVPSAYGGLNNKVAFKGIDFSFFIYYRLGYMVNSQFQASQATMQGRYNNLKVDYWTINNPTNEYPRPNLNQENPQFVNTLRYQDAGFVKLRTVTLGYTLPSSITSKLMVSNLRIYVSAQNPLVWSKYDVMDPESVDAIDAGDVPSNKLFIGGINLTF